MTAHVLYETKDADRPDVICDRNGEVVLALCRHCGKGESELLDHPKCTAAAPRKFQLGDRVRVKQSAGFHRGAEGEVVTAPDLPVSTGDKVVWVLRDRSGSPVWYQPAELELLPKRPFRIGDKVRVRAAGSADPRKGRVHSFDPYRPTMVWVQHDVDGCPPIWYSEGDLELDDGLQQFNDTQRLDWVIKQGWLLVPREKLDEFMRKASA